MSAAGLSIEIRSSQLGARSAIAQVSEMPTPYHPPIKRSVEIAGHKTSISLEPLFWELLRAAAEAEGLPLNALVARIDAERIIAPTPPGLASAIRLWLVARSQP